MDTKCLHSNKYFKIDTEIDFCKDCGILILRRNVK
jgi:hypothetical protein